MDLQSIVFPELSGGRILSVKKTVDFLKAMPLSFGEFQRIPLSQRKQVLISGV
jgi:hypothetical protein